MAVALYNESQLMPRIDYARQLAERLQLALVTEYTDQLPYLLVVTDQRLELHQPNTNTKPLCVDFLSAACQYRSLRSNGKNELIAKAMGIKSAHKPTIVDATAGLGEDSFVLASLGCRVRCLERSAIIAALLQDGLQRFLTAVAEGSISLACKQLLLGQISLHLIDAITYLSTLPSAEFPDVVYLDPMFPAREKSALVKKPMRILRTLVGDDQDASVLLALALQRARKRVVVKRPRLAPALAGKAPDTAYRGQASRFDVYFV